MVSQMLLEVASNHNKEPSLGMLGHTQHSICGPLVRKGSSQWIILTSCLTILYFSFLTYNIKSIPILFHTQ